MENPLSDKQRRYKYVVPTLFPLAAEVVGQTFMSQVGRRTIGVQFPESEIHNVYGPSDSRDKTPDPADTWIVPRSIIVLIPDTAENLNQQPAERDVTAWWRRTTDWLSAWVGVSVAEDVDIRNRLLPETETRPRDDLPPNEMQFYGYGRGVRASVEETERAFELAGSEAEMPAAYRLLVHSRLAFQQFDHRVCAIDACGAAEVAAGGAIERALLQRQVPPPFVAFTLKQARGLMDLYKAVISLDLSTETSRGSIERLAQLRNRAAHAGEMIDRQASQASLATARAFVLALSGRAGPDR